MKNKELFEKLVKVIRDKDVDISYYEDSIEKLTSDKELLSKVCQDLTISNVNLLEQIEKQKVIIDYLEQRK